MRFYKIFKHLLLLSLFFCTSVFAENEQSFSDWLTVLRAEALANHISDDTITRTFKNADFLTKVVRLDKSQPEFISTFFEYVDKRVTPNRVEMGREKLETHRALLDNIEQAYGVPKNILVAFWGLETNFGANQGSDKVASSLITLAYEGRRADFFRKQLIDAMAIDQAGHRNIKWMHGSWAGAMGHMQFMPSTFLQYGVDADQNGRIDVWNSLPDAFSSAANYLSSIGWRQYEPVMIEVTLPESFPYEQAHLLNRKSTADWSSLGVTTVTGNVLPALENTAIVIPQGWRGPAFVITRNFDVVMKWNRSVNYAFSVGHLANQFDRDQPIVNANSVDMLGLSVARVKLLQASLNTLGYESGFPDGYPGLKTQSAIRSFQVDHGLPADGYASPGLFSSVMRIARSAQKD